MRRSRVRRVLIGIGLLGALSVLGQMPVSAASRAPAASDSTSVSPHTMPFLSLKPELRPTRKQLSLHRAGSAGVTLRGKSDASAGSVSGIAGHSGAFSKTARAAASPTTPVPADNLTGFAGTAQASNINSFGLDQAVTPPNEDIAVGVDIVEVVNSTIVVFSRAGTILGSDDLNTFMDVARGYHSSDPRVIYDTETGHIWVTVTEIPNSGCSPQPVLIAVSANANPLPFSGWRVYALPIETAGTTFGDQPGLGGDSNTIVVTFDDFSCSLHFLGSEVDILQKSDLETDTGQHKINVFYGGPFAPQPVEELYGAVYNYVVTNESDCGPVACPTPQAEVDLFQGSPKLGGVYFGGPNFVAMTATAVNNSTGFLPPADQPSPGPRLQTNDDRFLNAVMMNGEIWTAGGTSCVPSGDTVQRACLDYLEVSTSGGGPTLTAQLNNVGVNGADLFYPAVAVDSAGNLFTVFDQSSTSMYPSIVDAVIPQGGTTFSSFQTLHTSSTYYNGNDLFAGACGAEGCRWGDYSGAAIDGANGADIWVVSGSEDNSVEGACVAHACWNTRINQLTLSGATITGVTPSLVPLIGGTTITVTGRDFAADTTVDVSDGITHASPAVHVLNAESLTFVAPPTFASSPTGGSVQVAVTRLAGGAVLRWVRQCGFGELRPRHPIPAPRHTRVRWWRSAGTRRDQARASVGGRVNAGATRRHRVRAQRDGGERYGRKPVDRLSG